MINNLKVEVKGIRMCKLELHNPKYPILTWCSLCSKYLIELGLCVNPSWFKNFHDLVMELYLSTTYFGSRFILDGFMVLDNDNYVLFKLLLVDDYF